MAIHAAARAGFGQRADAYERGRPGYPPAATSWLIAQLGLAPGRVAVDVGAGTGKLTRALARSGAELIAVEPVAAMREQLAARLPEVRILDGTAEQLPLSPASVDAILAGQAFHWFDGPRALGEFRRVLRDRGRLALVWNRRPPEHPLHRAIEQLIAPHIGDAPRHASGDWRRAFATGAPFAQTAEIAVPFVQRLTRSRLVDRVASTSVIAALPDGEREALLDRVRALAAVEPVELPYVCEATVFAPAGDPG